MRTLKLVFHVEDADTKEVILASDMDFDLLPDQAAYEARCEKEGIEFRAAKAAALAAGQKGNPFHHQRRNIPLVLSELARNHTAELVTATKPPVDEGTRLACKAIMDAKKIKEDAFLAIGDMVQRILQ